MARFTASFAIFLLCLSISCGEDSKRILVNDPSYFETRLQHLETLTQNQAATIAKQQAEINDLKQQDATKSYAAGGYYGYTGGSSTYHCLPNDPLYGPKQASKATTYGWMFGAENESNFYGTNSDEQDVPCAVCSTTQSLMLMIPGRYACYPGWTTQYRGYLAGNTHTNAAQYEYVCVDETVEYVPGGHNDYDGAVFMPIRSDCDPLRCPPYRASQLLACVVCTK